MWSMWEVCEGSTQKGRKLCTLPMTMKLFMILTSIVMVSWGRIDNDSALSLSPFFICLHFTFDRYFHIPPSLTTTFSLSVNFIPFPRRLFHISSWKKVFHLMNVFPHPINKREKHKKAAESERRFHKFNYQNSFQSRPLTVCICSILRLFSLTLIAFAFILIQIFH